MPRGGAFSATSSLFADGRYRKICRGDAEGGIAGIFGAGADTAGSYRGETSSLAGTYAAMRATAIAYGGVG
jgi:hypothetical protein